MFVMYNNCISILKITTWVKIIYLKFLSFKVLGFVFLTLCLLTIDLFICSTGYWHWPSGLGRSSRVHMHTADTVAVDGHRLRYAQSCRPDMSCRRDYLLIARGYCSFCATAAQRLNWKYGHHVGRLYDSSSGGEHCAHFCRIQQPNQLFNGR